MSKDSYAFKYPVAPSNFEVYIESMKSKKHWLKKRGYIHITNQLDTTENRNRLISIIKNKDFISKYAFFPLIHDIKKERRLKRDPSNGIIKKSHTYKDGDVVKSNVKKRPLHYATHLDAAIYSYYSNLIKIEYEKYLNERPQLSESITAYREIKKSNGINNKSTINFANEVFLEIQERSITEECVVLKFDIKSFFNEIDHTLLKKQWAEILGMKVLPQDHYNVFKGVTRFSYIMKDDLRIKLKSVRKKSGFDEKKLSQLRKKRICAFFESANEFRNVIESGKIKIHKFPFRKNGIPCGFPQGLPISSTLANMYLLKFDESIIGKVVVNLKGFYRRYSDDIIVLTTREHMNEVESFVIKEITNYKLIISEEKTERFVYRHQFLNGSQRIESFKLYRDNAEKAGIPLTYLGFEFYGYKTLVKSANLAKFYRRMISSVKIKTRRTVQSLNKNPTTLRTIYKNQLFRLYARFPLSSSKLKKSNKIWGKNQFGYFYLKSKTEHSKFNSNYLSYIQRASEEMSEPAILNQIRNHKKILFSALSKHKIKSLR